MVVIVGWKSSPIGRSSLLKSICNLSRKLIAESSITLNDVNLIIHAGVYRRNFRTEPAFASHVQGELGLKCKPISQQSNHCFSFDVSDGSCSPYVALNSAKHMLKIKSGGYALITVGDERPNAQSKWSYQPISCVMLVALEGDGARLKSTTFDSKFFDSTAVVSTIFDETKSANIIAEHTPFERKGALDGEKFIGDANWLSGQHMHEFLTKYSQAMTKIHQINDHSGKTVTATWM
ncbi:MAG: hypothetical protein ACPGK2_01750 [Candidatus Poseidoniaceae archaeon]